MWGVHFRSAGWDKRAFYTGLDRSAGKELFATQRFGRVERTGRQPDTFSLFPICFGYTLIGAQPQDLFVTTEDGKIPSPDTLDADVCACTLEEMAEYAIQIAPSRLVVTDLAPVRTSSPVFAWSVHETGSDTPQYLGFYGVDNLANCTNPDPRLVRRALTQSWQR